MSLLKGFWGGGYKCISIFIKSIQQLDHIYIWFENWKGLVCDKKFPVTSLVALTNLEDYENATRSYEQAVTLDEWACPQ